MDAMLCKWVHSYDYENWIRFVSVLMCFFFYTVDWLKSNSIHQVKVTQPWVKKTHSLLEKLKSLFHSRTMDRTKALHITARARTHAQQCKETNYMYLTFIKVLRCSAHRHHMLQLLQTHAKVILISLQNIKIKIAVTEPHK